MEDLVTMWASAVAFVIANKDDIRNWGLVIVPAVSALGAWHISRHKLKIDERLREEQEQRLIHTENADQTNAMTAQFRAIMEGYQSRVTDLSHEVGILRLEVISLRKTLDRQRVICGGCPKLPLLLQETPYAAANPAAN